MTTKTRRKRAAKIEPVATFTTADHGELVFIEYDERRRPFNAIVREERNDYFGRETRVELVEYEFEHGREHGAMYRESGGNNLGTDGTICVRGGFARGKPVRRPFWAAEGVEVIDADTKGTRLPAPLGDPFSCALATESTYCSICCDYFPEDDTCHHVYWIDGCGECGPGTSSMDASKVPEGFKRVVRFAGCARSLLHDLTRKRGADIFISTPLIGAATSFVKINGREFGDRIDELYNVRWPEGMVQEGCGWLRALDAKTKEANAATVAWLREEIAAQDARRASGAAVYEVWAGRFYPEQCTGKVAWAVAWQWVRDLRAAGVGDVQVVRRVPRAKKRGGKA